MTVALISELIGSDVTVTTEADVRVSGISFRSDQVRPGDAFFCVPGFVRDGHDFAADAVARGAAVLVMERALPIDAPQIIVADTRVTLAKAAAAFYGQPSDSMALVGITGTNGKTTTAYLLDSIMRSAGHVTGLIGTVETRIGQTRLPSSRTTPESAELHELLRDMIDAGVTACTMEVSSHAIDLHRVDGVRFACAGFTNLTQDHLDFHHTFEEYYSVKKRLFTDFDMGARVVNVDDPYGRDIAASVACTTVGRIQPAHISSCEEHLGPHGSQFVLTVPGDSAVVSLPLAGAFNISNALVAAGCALAAGIDFPAVVAGLASAPQVPGRLERIECGQPFSVVVDYAHTPDSLEKAVAAVREVTQGRVITVFGCGGDRDPDKRPMMGRAAGQSSDQVIVTSDNPRSEDPVGIILQIEDGLRGSPAPYEVVVDRAQAIAAAIGKAQAGDTVLIAGKGHEDYQVFADRTIHFDDREVAKEVLGGC